MNTTTKKRIARAFRVAFPYTIPIFAGFLFLGLAYGFYMHSLGFSFVYPMLTSATVFAGSMEFVAADLLCLPFSPISVFFLTLMVNARHLFYGISMLEKYRATGKKRYYLIFGMCDESFSINYIADPAPDVDRGWFMFFVTLLNQLYWVLGATLGGLLGNVLTFDTTGIDFVMSALFIVIFLDYWFSQPKHTPAVIGILVSALCLVIFGPDKFIIPSMLSILLLITLLRKKLETDGAAK